MAVPNVLGTFWRLEAGYDTELVSVGTSQVIKAGDWLRLSSGLAVQAVTAHATTATLATDVSTQTLLGVALHDITTTGSVTEADKVLIAVANDRFRCALRFYAASASDAEVQDATLGNDYGLSRYTPATGTADAFYVAAIAQSTGANLIYAERFRDSDPGDDYGVGWFSVSQALRDLT